MILTVYGCFDYKQESEIDNLILDLHSILNANDLVFSHNIYDDFEYQGEIDEPAGIIGGKLTVIADVERPRHCLSDIIDTMEAYEIPSIEIDY